MTPTQGMNTKGRGWVKQQLERMKEEALYGMVSEDVRGSVGQQTTFPCQLSRGLPGQGRPSERWRRM